MRVTSRLARPFFERSVIGFVICARDSVDETVTVPFE